MRALLLAVAVTTAAAVAASPICAQQAAQHPTPQTAQHNNDQHKSTPNGDHIPQERAADSYAIYSLLMPGKLFEHIASESATRWAVAQKTVGFADINPRIDPRGALKPPPGDEEAFHQAVADFERLQDTTYRLRPRLHLDRPYDLLDPDQVRDLRHAKSGLDPGSRLQARYAAYPGVTFFSAVYFSDDQKAALVYVNDWCGVLCAQAQWVFLQKENGHWERMSGITIPGT